MKLTPKITWHSLRRLSAGATAIALLVIIATPGKAHALSSWNPTLLVNTEAFETIDDGDGASDIELRFGDNEDGRIIYETGAEVFHTTKPLIVGGALTATGTISASGNIVTEGNMTINEDAGAADAVLTFGNDAGNETITFSDTSNQFEFSDDVEVSGALSGASITISNLESCDSIDTDINGNLSCGTDDTGNDTLDDLSDNDTDDLSEGTNNLYYTSDRVWNLVQGSFVKKSGDTMTGALTVETGLSTSIDASGIISGGTLHAQDLISGSGDLIVAGSITGANLSISGLANCNTIDTDANGNFVCGTDESGDFTQAAADDRYVNVSGDTMTGSLSISGAALAVSGTILTNSGANIEGNLTINSDDDGADAVLNFGNDAGVESITFSDTNNQFEFTDDIQTTGNIAASGSLKTEGDIETEGNLTINEDAGASDAVLTFGNDAGNETITFSDTTNQFEFSDDLEVFGSLSGTSLTVSDLSTCDYVYTDSSGNLTCGTGTPSVDELDDRFVNVEGDTMTGGLAIHSTDGLTSSGEILTESGLTINSDGSPQDATITFGNDAGNETLKFNDTTEQFEFSDDVNATGNLTASGNLTIEGTTTFNDVTYTWPESAASASGQMLSVDPVTGQLTWTDVTAGDGSGGIIFLKPEYPHGVYFGSGSTDTGQMRLEYDTTNNENYYSWITSKNTLQDYWISVQVRVPDNFSSWDPVAPIQFQYQTSDGVAANNHLTIKLLDTTDTEIALTGGSALTNAGAWVVANVTGPESSGTYTPGSYITILVKMAALKNKYAYAGYIELNWETTTP